MLDDTLDRVALNILHDGDLGVVAELDGEQGVGVTQRQRGLLHREGDEHGLVATGVDGRRDLVGYAQTAGDALAELVADFAFEADGVGCHSGSPH